MVAFAAPYVIYNWQAGGPLWQQPEQALGAQPGWWWAAEVVKGLWADNPLLLCAAVVGLPAALLAGVGRNPEHRSVSVTLVPVILIACPGVIWREARAENAMYAAAYLTPVVAVLVAAGLFVMHRWARRVLRGRSRGGGRAGLGVAIGVMCAAIAVLVAVGHRASWEQHGMRVKKVERLHGQIGEWASSHLPYDASIASREVGAIGFLSGRRMVDLGGTISQEGIGFLRRPGSRDSNLLAYLEEARPSHVAIRPADFWDLSQRADLLVPALSVVVTDPVSGGVMTMTLYETPWRAPSVRGAREEADRR